jgi:hypothetical protein
LNAPAPSCPFAELHALCGIANFDAGELAIAHLFDLKDKHIYDDVDVQGLDVRVYGSGQAERSTLGSGEMPRHISTSAFHDDSIDRDIPGLY